MSEWSDFELIDAILAEGTLAGAARRLNVNQTTAMRRLMRLESGMGLTTFDRVNGRLAPTPPVLAARDHIATMAEAARAAAASLRRREAELSGRVTVSSLGFYLARVLAPRLGDLRSRHPGIALDLVAEDRSTSFERREADIAVRFFETGESVALTSSLGEILFRRYGALQGPSWLDDDMPVVRYEDTLLHVPEMQLLNRLCPQLRTIVRSNRLDILVEAAANLGAQVMLPERLGDQDPRFTRLDPDDVSARRPLYLLVHPARRHAPPVDAVVRWLRTMD